MADPEGLKLPKPVSTELLNLSSDRRLDLLGFVRPDEVEELKAYNMDAAGNRYYLVHWKDSWKPESALIYCDKIVQQFWQETQKHALSSQEQSSNHLDREGLEEDSSLYMPHQEDGEQSSQSEDEVNISVYNNTSKGSPRDILNVLEHQVVTSEGISVTPLTTEAVDYLATSFANVQEMKECENPSAALTAINSGRNVKNNEETSEENIDLEVDSNKLTGDVPENEHFSMSVPQDNQYGDCGESNSNSSKTNTDLKFDIPDGKVGVNVVKYDQNQVKVDNCSSETEAESICLDTSMTDINDNQQEDNSTTTPSTPSKETSCESPSKKGASKRKNLLPKMHCQQQHPQPNKNKSKINNTPSKKAPQTRSCKRQKKGEQSNPKTVSPSTTATSIVNGTDTVVENNLEENDKESTNQKITTSLFKCMVCDKNLTCQQNLMKHLLTHNNKHTCHICSKTFKSTHFLKHHMDKHNPTYEYGCPVCQKRFKFKNNMQGHLRKHTQEKRFECKICLKKFMGPYNLREHMKTHSDDRPYECDFCRKKYKDRGALSKHMLKHQEKHVSCDICKREFLNSTQVKRHMRFHMSWPGDTFIKQKLGKTNTTNGNDAVGSPEKDAGETNPKKNSPDEGSSKIGKELRSYQCKYCHQSFRHYSNMNAHTNKVHKEKKVKCEECDKMFTYQYELRVHMFIHQNETGEEPKSKYQCVACGKFFQRATTLKNHERTTHLGIKRFKCEVCGKEFGTKFNMKVHLDKQHSIDNNTAIDGDVDSTNYSMATKPKRTRSNNNKRSSTANSPQAFTPSSTDAAVMANLLNYQQPQAGVAAVPPPPFPGVTGVGGTLNANPLSRGMSTSDMIRNAMSTIPVSNLPDLNYFPVRGPYQFYGIPPPDFGVS